MIGSNVHIRVDDREVQMMLDRATNALEERSLAIGFFANRARPYVQGRIAQTFDEQASPHGEPWKELTELTQAYRFHQGFNPTWPINVRYGDLREWLETDEGDVAMAAGSIQWTYPGPAGGEQEKKLLTAQTGEGATAARPVLGLAEVDVVALLGFLQGYLEMAMTTGITI